MSVYEKIRSLLDIVEVVSDYFPLKKVGNSYTARCPFHPDRTPSFYVSPSRQIFKCFGCGKGGDVIKFVAEYENVSYREAAKLLVERYNLPVSFGDEERETKEYSALRNMELFYKEKLLKSSEAKNFLLKVRKLPPSAVEEFGLGFCGDGFESVSFARKEGIFEILLELKHFYRTADGRFRDFFHGRITIPIKNPLGRVVAFGGRSLSEELKPKYKNSPNSGIFQKEKALFGVDRIKETAKEKGFTILVEGYFDVIRLHSVGLRNAVAPLGTALTVHQARVLKRFAPSAILLFDGDAAGRRAAFEAAKRLLSAGVEPLFCFLPEGEDPDSFVLNYGIKALRRLLEEAKPAHLYLIERAKGAPTDRLEKIASLYKELVESVSDGIKKELLYREFENSLGISLKGKKFGSPLKRFSSGELDPVEVDFLMGLLYLDKDVNLEDFNLSERAKGLAKAILEGRTEHLPSWLFEVDKTELERRFELAKHKLFERKIDLEGLFRELYLLERAIKEGRASREDLIKFSTLMGELNRAQKILYAEFKERLERELKP